MKKIKLNTSMENIKGKSPYVLLVPLFLLVLYFGYAWDIVSLQDDLAHAKQQETELKEQISRVVLHQSTVQKSLTQLPQRKAQLALWQKQVISYEQVPELLDSILSIGGSNHLYLKSFLAGKETDEGTYTKVPIQVGAYGDYHQLATFISQIANMKWIVAETNLVIARDTDSATAKLRPGQPLDMELELDVYYFSLPKPVAPPKKPVKGAKPNAP